MVDVNGTVIAQFLNFFILVFILAKFAYKPLLKIMQERRAKIADDIDSAEIAKAEAEKLKADYEQQIRNARQEAQEIVEKAVKEAETISQQQLSELRAQISSEKEKAQKELELEHQRAMDSLRSEVISLSMAIAGKLVEKNMNSEVNTKLVDETIEKLNINKLGL